MGDVYLFIFRYQVCVKKFYFLYLINEYTPPGSLYLVYVWRIRYIVILEFSKVIDWSNSNIKLLLLEIIYPIYSQKLISYEIKLIKQKKKFKILLR